MGHAPQAALNAGSREAEEARAAGFAEARRLFQGTAPYEGWRVGHQLVRLLGVRLQAAPQHHLWLAARRES